MLLSEQLAVTGEHRGRPPPQVRGWLGQLNAAERESLEHVMDLEADAMTHSSEAAMRTFEDLNARAPAKAPTIPAGSNIRRDQERR